MRATLSSLLLAVGQLADPRILGILTRSMAVSLVAFVLLAGAGWWGFDTLLQWLGLANGLFSGAGALRQVASILLAGLGLWLTWRIIAMLVIEFYADDVVAAVEARHYPEAAIAARQLSWKEQGAIGLRASLRALVANLVALPFALALLFTGIGPALLFWLVNALLLGRELQDMVWLRHRRTGSDPAPIGRGERFLLGGAITALLTVPVVNFLAPVLGAAAATHLIHQRRNMRHA